MTKKLLVIIPDQLSALIQKGEVVPRYYNPGNLFDEVHIMMTNDDRPDPALVQTMVGTARLFLHNYPEPEGFFKKTLGWRPFLMKKWAEGAVKLARKISPNLIRCHGAHLNTFLAAKIRQKLGIPYVVSLHINPNENFRKSSKNIKQKIVSNCLKSIEKIGLRNSNLVMPVYEPIVPYLKSMGISAYEVCYNVINGESLVSKTNYKLSTPVRLITIGRLFDEKNPLNIIKAVARIPSARLTIVGTGSYKARLEQYVQKNNLKERVEFIPSIANNALCTTLHKYDIVALHTEYFEFSKVVIESFLAGMPVILNYRKSDKQVPELNDKNCLRVQNTETAYLEGLTQLIKNKKLRKSLGQRAKKFAEKTCLPKECEKKYAEIYKKYISQ